MSTEWTAALRTIRAMVNIRPSVNAYEFLVAVSGTLSAMETIVGTRTNVSARAAIQDLRAIIEAYVQERFASSQGRSEDVEKRKAEKETDSILEKVAKLAKE
jgi:hypothetical protein